jgi:hypothetical protein
MLIAEDLIDDYINGNFDTVRSKLSEASPIVAAVVAVDLYRILLSTTNSAGIFIDRLRSWQIEN